MIPDAGAPDSAPDPSAGDHDRSPPVPVGARAPAMKRFAPIAAVAVGGLPGWVELARLLAAPPANGADALLQIHVAVAVLGTALFAASFVLTIRFGWLERGFGGLDRLYFAHHVTGALAFLALLLHPLLLRLGYLLDDAPAQALRATLPRLNRPDLLIGWVALLWLMAMLLAGFHARLTYSAWKWLHATSGLAFLLALGHIVLARPHPGLGHPLLAPWAVIGIAAFVYRALIEHGRAASSRFRVSQVRHLGNQVVALDLAPLGKPIAFAPGQFVLAAFDIQPGYCGCSEYHPFTVASGPSDPVMRLMVKAQGDCTARMQDLAPGVVARVQGPFGAFLAEAAAGRPQVWIAGGVGITPFLAMLDALAGTDGAPIDLFYAAPSRGDAACLDEVSRLVARAPRVQLTTAFDDRDGLLSADRIAAQTGTLAGREFFLCGPPAMVRDLGDQLQARGVPAGSIHAERFDFR